MSPRLGSDERLRRLLSIIPWVAANDGPAVDQVTARFAISEQELAADLELLYMCGLWPYSPDMLIEADIADGRVWIRYAEYFARPLRLTPAEGLALVASGNALLALPGVDPEGPLARGLAKLAGVLGVDPDEVEVELAPASSEVLDTLRAAVRDQRQVSLDYYTYGRDSRSLRRIEPWDLFSQMGQWYVRGHCHQAGGERLFRVDRIRTATVEESGFERPVGSNRRSVFDPRADDPIVVLDLAADARWVAEQYPIEWADEIDDGGLRVALRVSEPAWMDRLLLRLGPRASVVEGPAGAGDAARRILARYRPR